MGVDPRNRWLRRITARLQMPFRAISMVWCRLWDNSSRALHYRQARVPSRQRPCRTLSLEPLEERVVLSGSPIVLQPGHVESFTYIDPDGDVVIIEIQGAAGVATLRESIGDGFGNDDGVLENGEQLGEIRVTNASADFQIFVRSDLSGGVGNRVVSLGELNAVNQVFRGLIAGNGIAGEALFELTSITARALSSQGQIRIGRITGDDTGAAIRMERLDAGTGIHVANTLTGVVAVVGNWNGTIEARGFWSGSIAIGGSLGSTGRLIGGNSVVGDVAVSGNLFGAINIGLRNYGRWTIVGNVGSTALITAGEHFNSFSVVGSFHGTLITQQTIAMNTLGGIGAAARFGSRSVNIQSDGSIHGIIRSTSLSYVQTSGSFGSQSRVYSATRTMALYGVSILPGSAQGGPSVQRIHYPQEQLQGATVITRLPYTISHPGIYVLRSDLAVNLSVGSAITIAADNVTLDMLGRAIINTNGATTNATGIQGTERSGLTVRNGTVRGFLVGIHLGGNANYSRIGVTNMRAIDNYYYGIHASGTGVTIQNSYVLGTGGSLASPNLTIPIGIRAVGRGARVLNCVIADFRRTAYAIELVGLHVDAAPNSTVSGNVFRNPIPWDLTWASWVNNGANSTHGLTDVAFTRNFFFNWRYGVHYSYADGTHTSNVLVSVPGPFTRGTDGGGNVAVP